MITGDHVSADQAVNFLRGETDCINTGSCGVNTKISSRYTGQRLAKIAKRRPLAAAQYKFLLYDTNTPCYFETTRAKAAGFVAVTFPCG